MSFANYTTLQLRGSSATSGASEQDAKGDLPETVSEFWAVVEKTAEANVDNLLTVWLQCRVATTWFDIPWSSMTATKDLTSATDTTADVTSKVNIVDADSTAPSYTIVAHYKNIPSTEVRVASVSSGTGAANTFKVNIHFRLNQF